MPVRERPAARGSIRGRRIVAELAREAEAARLTRGLSYRAVGRAMHLSGEQVARICRGESPHVSIVRMAAVLETLGLELGARAYPGASPVRDRAHVALLGRLRSRIGPGLRWKTEVPVVEIAAVGHADLRTWDATICGRDRCIGVEAETHVRDTQELERRLALKQRDGGVDAVLLLLADSHWHRDLLRLGGAHLRDSFPIDARSALRELGLGRLPAGSTLLVL